MKQTKQQSIDSVFQHIAWTTCSYWRSSKSTMTTIAQYQKAYGKDLHYILWGWYPQKNWRSIRSLYIVYSPKVIDWVYTWKFAIVNEEK